MTYVYLALLGRRCFLKCCTFYFMHLLGSRSLDWSWRRRRSARCQRQPLFCLPLGRVRGQFEGRWTDSFSRGSRGFGDCRKSARTLETRSFCSPTCAAMVLSCIWQAEIHCCGLHCPKASLGHGHVSIGAAEWPQRPRLPLCLGARRSRQRILASILALRYGILHGSCKRSLGLAFVSS